jgi:hypothetical protein
MREQPMTTTHTIEFSVSDTILDSDEKCEAIVESIIDEFVPAVGITTGTCPDEIAVRLMIELAFQIGATHSANAVLDLLVAVTDAARAGQAAALETHYACDHPEQDLIDMECVPGKH